MCPASVKQLVLLESSMKFPVWCVCVHGHVQLGLTLSDPVDCSPPGSSVHGSLRARVLERVAISSSTGSPRPRDRICAPCIGRRILYHPTTWEALSCLMCSFYSRLCYLCETVILTQ